MYIYIKGYHFSQFSDVQVLDYKGNKSFLPAENNPPKKICFFCKICLEIDMVFSLVSYILYIFGTSRKRCQYDSSII